MLSVLAPLVLCAATIAALGTLAVTWARTREGWAALSHEMAADTPVNGVTVTLRHTSVATAPVLPEVVIYRPVFATSQRRAAPYGSGPFASALRVLRAAA